MIKLEISDLIVPDPTPHNTYEIVVNVMHGDADHFENKSLFGECDLIIGYIQIFNVCKYLNQYDDFKSTITNVIKDMKILPTRCKNIEDLVEWYCEFIGRDITDGGCEYYATPDSYKLYWYDNEGNKFKVTEKGG